MSDPNRPENVRLAIAAQPSIEQSVSALLRTVATHLHEAVESGDATQLKALADHVTANPRVWSDAILAHTPAAEQTIPPSVPQMPVGSEGDALEAVKAQPTIEQRIAALFRPIADALNKFAGNGDTGAFQALAEQINKDPRAWSDAMSAGTSAPTPPAVSSMPAYVQAAFRDHSVLAEEAQKRAAGEQHGQPHQSGMGVTPEHESRQPQDTGRLANERIAAENREPEVVERDSVGADQSAGADERLGGQRAEVHALPAGPQSLSNVPPGPIPPTDQEVAMRNELGGGDPQHQKRQGQEPARDMRHPGAQVGGQREA